MELYSVNLVSGLMLGIEFEELEGDNYAIIALGIIEIILIW